MGKLGWGSGWGGEEESEWWEGTDVVYLLTFAHPCFLLSAVLSAVLAVFKTSPLGLINGWPHLFDWKCTSSWFWNIGKYALSSPPSQKLAQCLRTGLVESQETGNNGQSTGSCSVGRIRLLSFCMPGLLSVTFPRGDHATHAAEPHMNYSDISILYLWRFLFLSFQIMPLN